MLFLTIKIFKSGGNNGTFYDQNCLSRKSQLRSKTTMFNALTGSSQYVGNWPGVTVEKKRRQTEKPQRCDCD